MKKSVSRFAPSGGAFRVDLFHFTFFCIFLQIVKRINTFFLNPPASLFFRFKNLFIPTCYLSTFFISLGTSVAHFFPQKL